jgi:hypothetical protein
MSQENVELGQSVFRRWNAGERTFPDEEIHPDVVVMSRILGKAVRGREGVRRYLREIDEQFDEWTMSRATSASMAGGAESNSINPSGFFLRSDEAS